VPRFQAALMGTFALIGLAIAAVGLYGILAYSIAQRTREFGIRLAVGATPYDIGGMVLRYAIGLLAVGFALGAIASVALVRLMASLVVGVSVGDAATYVAAAGLVAMVALTAAWLPARRATRVDPAVALRHD
jgi:ABC-type antimicrobial peptide transport system permease subunit